MNRTVAIEIGSKLDGCTIAEAIELLQDYARYDDVRLTTEQGSTWDRNCSNDYHYELFISYDRPETESEREERETKERGTVERREAAERAEYQRLHAKFGAK